MCGIAGFIITGLPYDPRAVVRRMVTPVRHRGPDDEGEYLDAHAALGACRLSIVDLAGGGSRSGMRREPFTRSSTLASTPSIASSSSQRVTHCR